MAILFSTERLIVRKFTADDHTDLAEILTDPVVTYFEPYQTFTKEACVQEAINFSKSNEFFAVVFEEKVIGKIYFSDRKYGTFEIGYTFNRAYQGKGFASESVKAMLHYAFEKLGVRRVIAEIDTRNEKSANLARHIGMRLEATHIALFPSKEDESKYNDFYIYAILKDELI